MKIKTLEIAGIARIKNQLNLKFNDGMNIVCGTNGVGKTTILNCIANFFGYLYYNIDPDSAKKNVRSEIGKYVITYEHNNRIETVTRDTKKFKPNKITQAPSIYIDKSGAAILADPVIDKNENEKLSLLHFNAQREFDYIELQNVSKDTALTEWTVSQINMSGVRFEDSKNWFIMRHLFEAQNELTETQKDNLKTAKKCFTTIDDSFSFSRITQDYDIMLNTPDGEIYFEYLSSGYKSCIYIMLGIIKEIELRFKNPQISASDFDGVILIDEIDLHLHPIWQTKIVRSLNEIFSKAQFILTTHSPHVIQAASGKEVIPLVINKNGDIVINEFETGEYGFQGWTIEEILEDVMGMENTKSDLYNKTLKDFKEAIKKENGKTAREKYEVLKEMVHPGSHLRKLFEIQMVGIEDEDD